MLTHRFLGVWREAAALVPSLVEVTQLVLRRLDSTGGYGARRHAPCFSSVFCSLWIADAAGSGPYCYNKSYCILLWFYLVEKYQMLSVNVNSLRWRWEKSLLPYIALLSLIIVRRRVASTCATNSIGDRWRDLHADVTAI